MVGEYQIAGAIGRGGFGTVYAGVHPLIGKRVAVKVLNRRFSADPDIVSRFVAEARAVNQIRHQHIIDIFSFGRLADGRQYYVMELLAGETLDRVLRQRGRLGGREAMQLLRPIARALDAAHAAGIAHRDLKPENVFVGRDSEGQPFPKLLDFGIAKLLGPDLASEHRTVTGAPMGTPLYMSPEQCRGRAVDQRTDIYSFGIMAYQVLTGALPFTGEDYMDILMKQMSDAATPPSRLCPELTEDVDAALAAMMAKDPAARPASLIAAMTALATALGRCSSQELVGGEAFASSATLPPPVDAMAKTFAPPARAASSGGSLAAGEMARPALPRRRARTPLWIGAAVIAAASVAVVLVRERATPARAAASLENAARAAPEPDGAPMAAVPPEAPVAASAPEPSATTISITIEGAPAGTRVATADGTLLGTAPGTLRVSRSSTALELRLEHEGYQALLEKVVPSGDRALRVSMKRNRTGKPKAGKSPRAGDEIGDF